MIIRRFLLPTLGALAMIAMSAGWRHRDRREARARGYRMQAHAPIGALCGQLAHRFVGSLELRSEQGGRRVTLTHHQGCRRVRIDLPLTIASAPAIRVRLECEQTPACLHVHLDETALPVSEATMAVQCLLMAALTYSPNPRSHTPDVPRSAVNAAQAHAVDTPPSYTDRPTSEM